MNPKGTLGRLWMLGWIELYVSFLVCFEQNDGACWFLENIKSEIPAESADMTLGYEDIFEGYGDSVWVLLKDGPKVWPVLIVNNQFYDGFSVTLFSNIKLSQS